MDNDKIVKLSLVPQEKTPIQDDEQAAIWSDVVHLELTNKFYGTDNINEAIEIADAVLKAYKERRGL